MPDASDVCGSAAVVGGGPAGLMAAETLAEAGLDVSIYEHMPSLGRKFVLAGRGGLNITHSEHLETFVQRYGASAGFLDKSIREFGPDDLRRWCASLGQPTFTGSSGRVFPDAFRATPLLRNWLIRLADAGIIAHTRHRWLGWGRTADGVVDTTSLRFAGPADSTVEVTPGVTVFALGGASWPRVGSDGGWVTEFERAGVEVARLRPANCGVIVDWSSAFITRFEGLPLKNTSIGVGPSMVRGDVVITRCGIEGGPIYALSATIREQIDAEGSCNLAIDLVPDLDHARLAERLRSGRARDSLATIMRRVFGSSSVGAGLAREASHNRLPRDPESLASFLKAVPLTVTALAPIDRAISTAGGVRWSELDENLMLRLHPGVFVAGEMIDWDAPTGGYLLQASFSTAVTAAHGAATWLASKPIA